MSFTVLRCSMCGVVKEFHEAKAHPYVEGEITASYVQAVLGTAFAEATIFDRVQEAARAAFADGRYEVFDVDASRAIENATKPGRVVVELETGGGLVGRNPDPEQRIVVQQNEHWTRQLGRIVAMSSHAASQRLEFVVGQQVVVTRCAGEEFDLTVLGFDIPARFTLVHVSDIEGLVRNV